MIIKWVKQNNNSSEDEQPFQELLHQLVCITPCFSVLSLLVAPSDFLYFLLSMLVI